MDDGAFDPLEGQGRPVPVEDSPFTDPILWMAHHIMKNTGLTIRQALSAACAANRGRLRDDVAALNRRIAAFNLQAPAAVHKQPLA